MIDDGGQIDQTDTTSEVDLDALFSSLDEHTVGDLKKVIKGFAQSYDGVGPQANSGFYYLNPFLSTSRRVFGELNSDQTALEYLIVDTDSLTEALASRSPDIEQLVGNLNLMMGAIGRRETELASAIGQLPDFMRQFNTTAVNLRAALDDVDPLVTASRPGRPQAAAVRAQPARVRARLGPDDQGARRDRQAQGQGQRPDRADRACRCRSPRSASARSTATARPAPGALPRRPRLWVTARTSSSSSAPTSPRTRSPAGSTTSATRASRTRSAVSAGSHHLQRVLARRAAERGPGPARQPRSTGSRRRPARGRCSTSRTSVAAPARTCTGPVLTPDGAEPAQLRRRDRLRSLADPARSARARSGHEEARIHRAAPGLAVAAGLGGDRRRRGQADLPGRALQRLRPGRGVRAEDRRRHRPGPSPSLDITPEKTALLTFEVGPDFPELKADASCSSEPQSLIAEYFLDCQPGSADEPLEEPIPAASNQTTVQNDLVQNTLREPFKRRFQLILNEFGTALVGNGENLNAAIRSGAPALRELRKVLKILGRQNRIIADLNVELGHRLRPPDRASRGRRPLHRRGRGHRPGLGRAPRGPLARLRPARRLPLRVAPGDERARQPRARADPAAGRPERGRRAGSTRSAKNLPAFNDGTEGLAQLARPRV